MSRLRRRTRSEEAGVALVITIMAMTLMAALGSALVMTTMTEARTAAHYAGAVETFYLADGAVEWALAGLPAVADWSTLAGVRFDGPASVMIPRAPEASLLRVTISAADSPPGAIVVRAEASGAREARRVVEATVVNTGMPGPEGVRLLAWQDLR